MVGGDDVIDPELEVMAQAGLDDVGLVPDEQGEDDPHGARPSARRARPRRRRSARAAGRLSSCAMRCSSSSSRRRERTTSASARTAASTANPASSTGEGREERTAAGLGDRPQGVPDTGVLAEEVALERRANGLRLERQRRERLARPALLGVEMRERMVGGPGSDGDVPRLVELRDGTSPDASLPVELGSGADREVQNLERIPTAESLEGRAERPRGSLL